jgi:ribosomal protein L11 methyltransferase
VEDDWTDAWREHYKPFKIGKRIVVRPFWEEYNPHDNQAYDEEIVFTIDPGHVFGTGQHQSTSLCINLLDKHLQKGDKILDIGCGSGILAIIALLLGAAHATAVDIDPAAAKMTITNAELNDIPKEKITAFNGNIFDEGESSYGTYDIVVANIVADVIIKLAPLAAKMLTTNGRFIEGGINGRFITGGIVEERKEEVAEALAQAGFSIGETLIQDGWVAFFCFVSLQRGRT